MPEIRVNSPQDDPFTIPNRSTLFSIRPHGLGTWKVECLPSFARRLAEAHGISLYRLQDLISKRINSINQNTNPQEANPHHGFEGFNLLGPTAQTWVDAINSLQHQQWASETTLLPIKDRVSTLHLTPRLKRYCPACYRADLGKDGAYEYLLWHIAAVTVCPEHGCSLEIAPRESQYFHARWALLSEHDQRPINGILQNKFLKIPKNLEYEKTRAKLVATLIESPFFKKGADNFYYSDTAYFLSVAIDRLMDGNATRLAEHLNINKSTLSGWINRKHTPTLECIIDIAQAFDCSIENALSGDINALPMILPGYPSQRERNFHRINYFKKKAFKKQVISLMTKHKSLGIPLSSTAIARALGVDRESIQLAHPELVRTMTNEYKKSRQDLRDLGKQIRHDVYRLAAIYLAKQGVLPTRNRVWNILRNIPLFSTDDKNPCQVICNEIRQEYSLVAHHCKRHPR